MVSPSKGLVLTTSGTSEFDLDGVAPARLWSTSDGGALASVFSTPICARQSDYPADKGGEDPMTAFLRSEDVRREQFDWGVIGWRCTPEAMGAKQLVVMDVEIRAGAGHDFHRHPVQEELITVGSGKIEQWVAEEVNVLGPGDSVYIAAGRVHASFNVGPETAHLRVVIGPAIGTGSGYELEDVSGQEPWASLRSHGDA